MKQLLMFFMQTSFYSWLLKSIIPYIRFTMYYSQFPGSKYHKAYDLLCAGDIILAKDPKKLTTLLIGGDWSHAALCVSKDEQFEVAEMTHRDFTKSTFFDICKEAEAVAIIRCADFDADYIKSVVDKCKSFEGATYDVTFTLGVAALYCSELVWQSDYEHRLKVSLEDIAGLGRPYISPTGLWKAENCGLIFDSRIN